MAFNTGGKFKAPATSQNYTHNHASQMAHIAGAKVAIGKALGSPVMPAAPVSPVMPASLPPVAPGSSYKAHIAHAAAGQGVHVSVNHIHDMIDAMGKQGHFTPLQVTVLKAHNGPMDPGPIGMNTMGKIVHAIVSKGKHG
ncbi:MAG: hypothetical protein V4457_12800 [Pseudomonadota bacterium]